MRSFALLLACLLVVSACASPEQRELAALKKELGLDRAPIFPTCLSQEVTPQAAVRSGDHTISHTINNPQGDVPIDECVRWDLDEPVGKPEKKPQKIVLQTPREKDRSFEDYSVEDASVGDASVGDDPPDP